MPSVLLNEEKYEQKIHFSLLRETAYINLIFQTSQRLLPYLQLTMTMDYKALEGKIYVFAPADDVPAFFKCFFNSLACPCLGQPTMIQHVTEKDGVPELYASEALLCGGKVPMSPCPLCVYCGVGPCAAEWHFVQVEGEPTKFTATGSAFACQTCEACTNHDGDWFLFDEDHDGTFEKPFIMNAGCNPMNPPCFAGMPVLKFYEASDCLGTPVKSTMDR